VSWFERVLHHLSTRPEVPSFQCYIYVTHGVIDMAVLIGRYDLIQFRSVGSAEAEGSS
jgi:hypothetical protein